MEEEKVRQLLLEYRKGTIRPEDRLILEAWYLSKVSDPTESLDEEQLQANLSRLRQAVMQDTKEPKRMISRFIVFSMSTAAIVLILIISRLLLSNATDNLDDDVMPGGNKAILTTNSGQAINLDEGKRGIVVKASGMVYDDGTPISAESNSYTIQTPNGGQYQVILSDGSKVWLNSSSKLHYPVKFGKEQRVVTVEGEAYFEVSHQLDKGKRIPFIVRTHSQEVTVVGTSFNISAYGDDPELITTLVNGKVSVSADHDKTSVTLTPGEESILTSKGMTVRQANVAMAAAWKQGEFRFHETELQDVMRQLSRWYDLEIVYKGDIPEKVFYGVISRDRKLTAVLDLLKESGVNFRIEKMKARNRLIVYP